MKISNNNKLRFKGRYYNKLNKYFLLFLKTKKLKDLNKYKRLLNYLIINHKRKKEINNLYNQILKQLEQNSENKEKLIKLNKEINSLLWHI